jgi:hypothetical protein
LLRDSNWMAKRIAWVEKEVGKVNKDMKKTRIFQ